MFRHSLSIDSLANFNYQCFERLEKTEAQIKEKLIQSPIEHFDETGCYMTGVIKWQHVVSNQEYTYYRVHDKRGNQAIEELNVLSRFKGTAIHYHWKSYFRYENCSHSLCNVHHSRELNAIIEFEKQEWAIQMKELLLAMKKYAETTTFPLHTQKVSTFEKRYHEVLSLGYQKNPFELSCEKKRGCQNLTKSLSLLNRFQDYQEEILNFLYQKDVPFDNNFAEGTIQMTKIKQKISGTLGVMKMQKSSAEYEDIFRLFRNKLSIS